LCIYAHSGREGLAPEYPAHPADVVSWQVLQAALPKGVRYLWLVGCESSESLKVWGEMAPSRRILATRRRVSYRNLVSFFELEIQLDDIVFDDEMLARIEEKCPEFKGDIAYYDRD